MNRDSALVAVGVGAAITVAFSFVPFSSVLGGAAAASRRNGGYLWGLGVGTAAGVAAAIPLDLLFAAAFAVVEWLGFGVPPSSPAYDLYLAIVALLFLLYTVGLSALGGLVGVWIRANTTWDLDPVARVAEYGR
ncbi:hypothetical protein SAMN05216559_2900 [Halomicrobium zhouii]|uniref:DUF5518 domain-containing protein n=1 Tax=Halomicrobium zhouii TaxID=767519 RepID=A0A1I6LQB6_9EURY|nr:DUF5518 domain-containing protein [Halomicrobium zhouii]SFS05675.1 hypothetical protein SAMN05216559_2900 [Halomicrobium zhouii]